MNNRQFKLHLAAIPVRKQQEEAAAERAKPAPTKAKAKPTTATASSAVTTVGRKPPASEPMPESYEPKIHFRIRRNRHR